MRSGSATAGPYWQPPVSTRVRVAVWLVCRHESRDSVEHLRPPLTPCTLDGGNSPCGHRGCVSHCHVVLAAVAVHRVRARPSDDSVPFSYDYATARALSLPSGFSFCEALCSPFGFVPDRQDLRRGCHRHSQQHTAVPNQRRYSRRRRRKTFTAYSVSQIPKRMTRTPSTPIGNGIRRASSQGGWSIPQVPIQFVPAGGFDLRRGQWQTVPSAAGHHMPIPGARRWTHFRAARLDSNIHCGERDRVDCYRSRSLCPQSFQQDSSTKRKGSMKHGTQVRSD